MRRPLLAAAATAATTAVAISLAVLVLGQRDAGPAPEPELAPTASGNGVVLVEVMSSGAWTAAGWLDFDQYLRSRSMDLSHIGPVERVRLTRSGGGAAHIDHMALEGAAPTWTSCGTNKLVAADRDVVELSESFEAAFAAGMGQLEIVARIEPEVISKTAFGYPSANTGRPVEAYNRFFTYEIGSRPGNLTIDGELANEDLGKPFFTDQQLVGSGHPQGTTYGWVSDDGKSLYVAIDFTSDNTEDDGLDYAKVVARTAKGVRAFRVSLNDRKWGAPGFTYTDKVGYQHMVYEFEIPLEELTVTERDGTRFVQLAFAAYGTSSPVVTDSGVAYSPQSGLYMVARHHHHENAIYLDMHDEAGNQVGEPQMVSDDPNIPTERPQHASTSYGAGRFLVQWEANDWPHSRLAGQIFDSRGQPQTEIHSIVASENEWISSYGAAANPDDGDFLVVFLDNEGVKALVLSMSDDIELGQPVLIDSRAWSAAAAYGGGKYLVVTRALGEESAQNLVSGVFLSPSGEPGTPFEIGPGRHPRLAYDDSTEKFVVTWSDTDSGVWVRAIGLDGSSSVAVHITDPDHRLDTSTAAYQPLLAQTLIAFHAIPNLGWPPEIRGVLFDSGNATWGEERVLVSDGWTQSVAANTTAGNFGFAYHPTWSTHEFLIHGEPFRAVVFETDGTEGARVKLFEGEPTERLELRVRDGDDTPEVKAVVPEHHTFVHWSHEGDIIEDSSSLTIAGVDRDMTVVASFAPLLRVTFESDGTLGAFLEGELEQWVAEGSSTEEVVALAPAGHRFVAWTCNQEVTGTGPAIVLEEIAEDMQCVASFERLFRVAFETDGTTGAYIEGDLEQWVTDGESTEPVTAVAPAEHRFTGWTSDGGEIEAGLTLVVENVMADMTIVATFAPIFTVTFVTDGTEGVTLEGQLSQEVVAGGSTEPVSAVFPSSLRFSGWTDGPRLVSSHPAVVVDDVHDDMTIVASFEQLLLVVFETDGTDGASIEGEIEQWVASGESTEPVTAVAPEGYDLAGWTSADELLGSEPTIVIENVMQPMTVRAGFSKSSKGSGCGCSTGDSGGSTAWLLLAPLAAWLATRRRAPVFAGRDSAEGL